MFGKIHLCRGWAVHPVKLSAYTVPVIWGRVSKLFSVKGQIGNTFSFGHIVSLETTHFCCCSDKTAIDNMQTISMSVFPQIFIYKNRLWAWFGRLVFVCRALPDLMHVSYLLQGQNGLSCSPFHYEGGMMVIGSLKKLGLTWRHIWVYCSHPFAKWPEKLEASREAQIKRMISSSSKMQSGWLSAQLFWPGDTIGLICLR